MTTWLDFALAELEKPTGPAYATPLDLAQAIEPATKRTPALELINQELVRLHDTPDGRLVASMSPQEGKTETASKKFPLWALLQNPELRIAIVSYEHNVARRISRSVRDFIVMNPQLGLRIRPDVSAQNEWQLDGHRGGVYSTGIGGALTGRPVDLMIIDDPVKDREQADSEVYRERAWDWWLEVGSTRLAPGAPVAVIATRWHHDDLIGRLLGASDGGSWRVVNIPAQADHKPEQGETDPLGREPGEYMLSARGRTTEQWENIKTRSGPRTWASLYQGRPTPDEGSLFPRDIWDQYTAPIHVTRADGTCWVPLSDGDELVQSWDMAFKSTAQSDYVVGMVLLRRGVHVWLLDMVRRRMDFTGTIDAVKALSARWPQALAKYVEDKANGTAVINLLASTIPGLIPVEPDGGKMARAQAVAPFVHAKNTHLPAPDLLPNVDELIEEAAAFPAGAHDDAVDCFTQGLNRLLINPLFGDPADEWDDDELPYTVSTY